jgi:RNA polymerase sigma factor (sigma-70 family)
VTRESDETERRLAEAAQAGDRRAFEHLVLLHKASLYRFVRHYVGDADEAYDLVQEAFISAWLALRRFDARQSFSVWLRAIALNKCRDYGRRRAVRRRLLALFAAESLAREESAVGMDVTPELRQAQRLRQLDQAIAALPRLYKEPLLLTIVSGLTQQQVAEELRTTPKAIEMRIRRAKKQLSQALSAQPSDGPAREG